LKKSKRYAKKFCGGELERGELFQKFPPLEKKKKEKA